MSETYTAMRRMSDAIGFDIGMGDSKAQAELFNGFARGINRGCGNQLLKVETQNAYIVEDLTPEAREYIMSLAGMCEASS